MVPEERLMTISSSSPHLAPEEVARHSFGSIRRGYDPSEVRAYLESIADGIRGLAEREQQLLQELADAEHRAAHPVLDEPTLSAAVGSETARVLHSAHEAASEMVSKAEVEANRMVAEANEEIAQNRAQTEGRLSELAARAEAAAEELRGRTAEEAAAHLEGVRREAEDLLERAREQCRAMVEEAQALRARVLADLSKRRKVLHAQIEQLRAGRERLTETVQDVRRSIDAIADDLFAAEDNARLAAEAAGREAIERPDEGTPEELAALLLAEQPVATEPVPVAADSGDGGGTGGATDGSFDGGAAPTEAVAVPEVVEVTEIIEVTEVDVETSAADDAANPDAAATPVEELFAKIRAGREEPPVAGREACAEREAGTEDPAADTPPRGVVVTGAADVEQERAAGSVDDGGTTDDSTADDAPTEDGPPEARNPLALQRDELIAPIVKALSRRLKRTLQDDQNELLDTLRSKGSQWSAELLPDTTEETDSYATAALPILEEAAEAGVVFTGAKKAPKPTTDELIGIAHALAEQVVGPLRRRLSEDGGIAEADEAVVAEHVGSAFREWKGERIERLAGDHVVSAFSAGTIAATKGKKSMTLEWISDPGSGDAPCPDCEDNGLNGSLQPDEEFPTGHRHPPAHPGCRCLLAVTAT